MAVNNSSAPLKTAGEPFVALGECIADQVCLSVAELPDRDSPADWPQAMLVTSDELRNIVLNAINYAAQAVAAQAAPAAVAVPEGWKLVPLQDTPKMWTAGGQAIKSCGGHDRDAASLAYKAMLEAAPTPALPATKDSSAGDLAEGATFDAAFTNRVIDALQENGDPVSVDAAEEMAKLRDLLLAAPQAQPADALDAAPAAPINSEALQVIKALREWVMAVPADVAAALPAMPGIDADWMDAVEAALATHSAPADGLMVNMTPPATSRDRWMYNQGRLAEVERVCAAIKTEDDYCVDQGDYMLDSDDCIKVARGTWLRPTFDRAAMAAAQEGGNAAKAE